jgi:hypothetical protein
MQFSRELTWKAVEVVLPHLKTLKENNISVNLTDALKDAAVELFIAHNNSTDTRGGTDWKYSEFIISRALLELKENGWLTFGDQEQFWA